MGRPIDGLPREELAQALKTAVHMLRSIAPRTFLDPEVEVSESPADIAMARTFKWAFLPAGHLWSEEDRREVQARLDAIAGRHGLEGARVQFGTDQLRVEVPRPLRAEQLMALQDWLQAEKDTLDISQVP